MALLSCLWSFYAILLLLSPCVNADKFSPLISPTEGGRTAMLLSMHTTSMQESAFEPSYAQQMIAHGAIVCTTAGDQATAHSFFVSRVVEVAYLSAPTELIALRYANGSVCLNTPQPYVANAPAINTIECIDGPFVQLSSGAQHLCLLRESGLAECRAQSSVLMPFNTTNGALLDQRADVRFSQISAADGMTCALRADDSRVECYGEVPAAESVMRVALNASTLQYSSIAAQNRVGFCGLVLGSGDLYCWSAFAPAVESLALPAPASPLFFRWPSWCSSAMSGCVLQSDGLILCANITSGGPKLPSAEDGVVLAAVGTTGGVLWGITPQANYLVTIAAQTIQLQNAFAFAPLRMIGVDNVQGNDTACAVINMLFSAELRAFVPCLTMARAFSLVAHPHTWVQLLPSAIPYSTGSTDDAVMDYSELSISSQLPAAYWPVYSQVIPILTESELALLGNGSWVQRVAAARAVNPTVHWNCTGQLHCLRSTRLNVWVDGLSISGSVRHAISHQYDEQFPRADNAASELLLTNLVLTQCGGMLFKLIGAASILRCSITESTSPTEVHGLIELVYASVVLSGSELSHNHFQQELDFVHSCIHAVSADETSMWIAGTTFDDNSASIDPFFEGVSPGGVAMQIQTSGLSLDVRNCTFRAQSVDGVTIYGGAISISTATSQLEYRAVTVEFEACVFASNSIGPSAFFGGGGSIAVFQTDIATPQQALMFGATLRIDGCVFTDSTVPVAGGALYLGVLNSLWIHNTQFSGCSASVGGTIGLYQSDFVLSFAQDQFVIEDSQITYSNAVSSGGALDIWGLSPAFQVLRTNIERVNAVQLGGTARFINCLSVLFEQCTVSRSNAGEGGSIYAEAVRSLSIQQSNFSSTSAKVKGGAISALFATIAIVDSNFDDATLSFNVDPNAPRVGGAMAVTGGGLSVKTTGFLRCSALPGDTNVGSCTAGFDSLSGLSLVGLGGCIFADLIEVELIGVAVDTAYSCSGAFLFAKDSSNVRLTRVTASDLYAYSGSLAALDTVATSVLSQISVMDSIAVQAGGAIVLTNCLAMIILPTLSGERNRFENVNCHSGDGGVFWTFSQRQLTQFDVRSTDFIGFEALGAGGVLFSSLSSAQIADAKSNGNLASLRVDLNKTDEDSATWNTFLPGPASSSYGSMAATNVVSLRPSLAKLTVWPGQLFNDPTLPALDITAFDAYDSAILMDRALVIQLGAFEDHIIKLTGTTLQKVAGFSGAAKFSGDLQISGPPGNYTLQFTLISDTRILTLVALELVGSCPRTRFYSRESQSCEQCASDVLVYSEETNTCEQCPKGWQRSSPATNATGGPLNDGVLCEPCPLGTTSASGARCESCGPNTYQPTPFSSCIPCSSIGGLLCEGDGLAQVTEGFFALSIPDGSGGSFIETFQCPESFCTAARLQQPTGSDVVTLTAVGAEVNSSTGAITSYGQCAFPRLASPTNLLCGECAEGYRPWGNRCSRCDSVDGGLLFGLIVLSLVLLAWLLRSAMNPSSAGHAVVLLYFCQTAMLELGSLNNLLAWLNIVLLSPNSVGRCVAPLSPYQQTQAQILMPLALWVELMLIAIVHFLAFKRWGVVSQSGVVSIDAPLPARVRAAALRFVSAFSLDTYLSATFSLLLFSYTQVAMGCVTYLRCVDVGGTEVVFAQPSMRCGSSEYAQTKLLVVIALVIYVAGLPIGICAFLWRKSAEVREAHSAMAMMQSGSRAAWNEEGASDSSSIATASPVRSAAVILPATVSFLRRYSPLFAMYSSSAWFWQVFVLCRRTVFVAISVALQQTPRKRFMAFTLASLASMMAQLQLQPFRDNFFNRAELASHVLLIILSVTLTAESVPFSDGVNAWIFMLIVPPLIAYVLWCTMATVRKGRQTLSTQPRTQAQSSGEDVGPLDKDAVRSDEVELDVNPVARPGSAQAQQAEL